MGERNLIAWFKMGISKLRGLRGGYKENIDEEIYKHVLLKYIDKNKLRKKILAATVHEEVGYKEVFVLRLHIWEIVVNFCGR